MQKNRCLLSLFFLFNIRQTQVLKSGIEWACISSAPPPLFFFLSLYAVSTVATVTKITTFLSLKEQSITPAVTLPGRCFSEFEKKYYVTNFSSLDWEHWPRTAASNASKKVRKSASRVIIMKICKQQVFTQYLSNRMDPCLDWRTDSWDVSLGAKLSGTLPDGINRLHEQNSPQKSGNGLLIKICET